MKEMKNFAIYTGYFHDGALHKIEINGRNANLFIKSAQMDTEELQKGDTLNKDDRLKGVLSLTNVADLPAFERMKDLLNNDKVHGNIFSLEIFPKRIYLEIIWEFFKGENNFEVLDLKCEEVNFYQHEY